MQSTVARNQLPIFEETLVVDWLIQILLSLDMLHDRKILHRDIKTQNIFISDPDKTGEFTIKLGDFGISKVIFFPFM